MIWLAVVLSLAAGIMQARTLIGVEEEVKKNVMFLERPQFEWVRPSADGTEMCLRGPDFMKQTMYVSGLEHIQRSCCK
jgi:hypothetical protein